MTNEAQRRRASAEEQLIRLLQDAHAGERAAGYAYWGHRLSVRDPEEAQAIAKIENEEWEHRRCLGEMLAELGAGPRWTRELAMQAIGLSIFLICRLGGWLNAFNFGWFASMFGAGRLESGNILEYVVAAERARDAGHERLVEPLLAMARVEWDHERFFREKCETSKWARWIPFWPKPAERASIGIPAPSSSNAAERRTP